MKYSLKEFLQPTDNWSAVGHGAAAVTVQLLSMLCWPGPQSFLFGGLIACAWWLGREVAQAEDRPNDFPSWAADKFYRGCFLWMWSRKSAQDGFYPVAACIVTTALYYLAF